MSSVSSCEQLLCRRSPLPPPRRRLRRRGPEWGKKKAPATGMGSACQAQQWTPPGQPQWVPPASPSGRATGWRRASVCGVLVAFGADLHRLPDPEPVPILGSDRSRAPGRPKSRPASTPGILVWSVPAEARAGSGTSSCPPGSSCLLYVGCSKGRTGQTIGKRASSQRSRPANRRARSASVAQSGGTSPSSLSSTLCACPVSLDALGSEQADLARQDRRVVRRHHVAKGAALYLKGDDRRPCGRGGRLRVGPSRSGPSSSSGVESDVPCNGCTACCRSSQFVHVGPDEADTLAHIPAELLFPHRVGRAVTSCSATTSAATARC